MARVAGIVFFKVDGKQYSARGSFEYQPLTTEKESVVGQDGYHGYKEMPVAPHIKGEITDNGQIAVGDWQLLVGTSVVTLELANGKVVRLNNAAAIGKIAVNTVDGKYELTLEGATCSETVAAA